MVWRPEMNPGGFSGGSRPDGAACAPDGPDRRGARYDGAHHSQDEHCIRLLTWRNDFVARPTGRKWPPSLTWRLGPEPSAIDALYGKIFR